MTAVLRRLGGAAASHTYRRGSARHQNRTRPGLASWPAPATTGSLKGKGSMPRTDNRSQLGRDYLWNTSSSLMTSLSTVVMLLVVTRVVGIEAAGVYSLALAVGQQFQTLGMYEVRAFHVTDVKNRFAFSAYHATRIVTVLLMILGILGYSAWSGGNVANIVLVFLVASLRVFDAYEDVFYCEFQRVGRLDVGARASFIRTLTTTTVFCVALVMGASLLLSVLVTLCISVAMMLAVFLPPARGVFSTMPRWNLRDIGLVLIECLPLFLASFVAMYLANAPRFAIDRYLDSERQGYFAILFMPAVTINLFALVVFRPLLTRMAGLWISSDRTGFLTLVKRGLLSTLGAFVVVGAITYLIGVPLLGLVFDKDISEYRSELIVLVAGGAMNSAGVILYYALTTMRLQRFVFVGYAVTACSITVLCLVLVPPFALMGASVAYVGAMLILTSVFAAILYRGLRSRP